MIKAIIFDCFGVLAGSAYKEIYRQAGGDLSKDNVFVSDLLNLANSGQITSEELNTRTAKRLGISVEKWTDVVNKAEQPNLELLDYVRELKSKYKVAILSNAGSGVMERKFTKEQLALFDTVVVSAEVGFIKPQPEIFKLTADRLEVELQECAFVDDLSPYVEGAAAVGMKAIQYDNFGQLKQELEVLLSHN